MASEERKKRTEGGCDMSLPKFNHMYRLTREPELTFSGNGMEICKVGLACSEKYGEKETQLFIDATAFKKTATMLNTVQKGHRIMALGKISTDSWQDKDTGAKRRKTVMIIESFEFIEPKSDNNQQSQGFQQQTQGQQPQNNGFQQTPDYSGGGFNQSPPDDLPF